MLASELIRALARHIDAHGDSEILVIVPTPGGRRWHYRAVDGVLWGSSAAADPNRTAHAIRAAREVRAAR